MGHMRQSRKGWGRTGGTPLAALRSPAEEPRWRRDPGERKGEPVHEFWGVSAGVLYSEASGVPVPTPHHWHYMPCLHMWQ
jgi:hypothetical protein